MNDLGQIVVKMAGDQPNLEQANNKHNEEDKTEHLAISTNPSEQTDIIGPPIDFSFCDVQTLSDLIKMKPNSGKRKPIIDESKKTNVSASEHVKSSVKVSYVSK